MLVHQNQTSEGTVSANVKLNDRIVSNVIFDATCHSGIKTGGGGVLSTIQANGGFSAISGEWLISGTPAAFFIQRTITEGTLEVDPGTGFLQMNTDRIYDNQKSTIGVKTTKVFFEISSDVSGVPVIDTADMTFTSERDFSGPV